MKKLSLLTILWVMIACANTFGQNVTIPDTIFKSVLVSNSAINTNSDDEIQISEAEAFTGHITVASLEILDLTGIESFINITKIDCQRNKLTKVNFSNNKKLESINTYRNYDLDTIILGNLPELVQIECRSNSLDTIDVSQCPNLWSFAASDNDFKSVDLSKNPKLKTVLLKNCQLTSLDVRNGTNDWINDFRTSNNPNLFCINVSNTAFAVANWVDVDDQVAFSTNCDHSYSISVQVSDGSAPIENAVINIEGIYAKSNPEGIATIDHVGSGNHTYSVYAEGYDGIIADFNADSDKTINVILTDGIPSFVYIPDLRFKSYLLNHTAINTNGDSEIQKSEAENYASTLKVNSKNIEDLTGIEAFINLSSLSCTFNNIKHLDVSKNVKLEGLYCRNNILETLQLGSLPFLQYLHATENKLQEINVEELPLLERINIDINQVKALDLRNNPNITSIGISQNHLIKVDLRNGNNQIIETLYATHNPELSCISVDDVEYCDSTLTNRDNWTSFGSDCYPYSINFNVQDGNNPIEAALITIETTSDIKLHTDALGKATISELPANTYKYKIEKDGYIGQVGKVTINDSDANVDIQLKQGTMNYVHIPDSSFRNALLNNKDININGDSLIQIVEAGYFEGIINVPYHEIKSMKGIEAFHNITELHCNGNQGIDTLDLSSVTELTKLECSSCDIDTLMISNMPLLEELNISSNNIKALDFSAFPQLKRLTGYHNDFSHIDLSNNPNLEYLKISNNKLISLNLRNNNNSEIYYFQVFGNPDLKCISVSDIGFANANWASNDYVFSEDCDASFDIVIEVKEEGNNNPISGAYVNFENILYTTNETGTVSINGVTVNEYPISVIADGYQGEIKNLEISKAGTYTINLAKGSCDIVFIPDQQLRRALINNVSINTNNDIEIQVTEANSYTGNLVINELNIKDMTGIEAFTKISKLNCSWNYFTSLDLTNNTALTEILCERAFPLKTLILGDKPLLTKLKCNHCEIEAIDVTKAPNLCYFQCDQNQISSLNLSLAPQLNTLIVNNNLLSLLNLKNNNNSNITVFNAENNPNLTCVAVNDVTFADTTWNRIDAGVVFSGNCDASHDADLAEIKIDNQLVNGFHCDTLSYSKKLPKIVDNMPVVSATISDTKASISITQVKSIPGNASIEVTAEDETTKKIYIISFTKEPNDDASLSELKTDDTMITDFTSETLHYTVLVEPTKPAPTVSAKANDENATITISQATQVPGTASIVVTAEDKTFTKTYTIQFEINTGINEMAAEKIKLYPQPTKNILFINSNETIIEIEIFDLESRKVMSSNNVNNSIDIGTLLPGTYLVKIKTDKMEIIKRLIKQ